MTGVTKVHHLNCGSFDSAIAGALVTHVLLCETDAGLVLVDTGIGTTDMRSPWRRLGAGAMILRPRLEPHETALHQVQQLGYNSSDVRHIVATHLDYDHISGAHDFPDAIVHVTATELNEAEQRKGISNKLRYRSQHLPVDMRVKSYDGPGDALLGFSTAYPIAGLDHIWLIPLRGHTRGHAAVAVRAGRRGWLFHAGDAFFQSSSISGVSYGQHPKSLRLLETALAAEPRRVQTNHDRLRELARDPNIGVEVFCSHDPVALHEMQSKAVSRIGSMEGR